MGSGASILKMFKSSYSFSYDRPMIDSRPGIWGCRTLVSGSLVAWLLFPSPRAWPSPYPVLHCHIWWESHSLVRLRLTRKKMQKNWFQLKWVGIRVTINHNKIPKKSHHGKLSFFVLFQNGRQWNWLNHVLTITLIPRQIETRF